MSQSKGRAVPLVRSPQQKAAITRAENQALAKVKAQRLAQVVNLMIAGMSIRDVANSIGATPDEVERMLTEDTARYVRTQPALRVYVRNFLSEKYTALLAAVWDEATDKNHAEKLENQDRALKILREMDRLHGAAAPVQTEVKIESAPEAVEKLVSALASAQGLGYDTNIFDVVEGEVVNEAVTQTAAAALDAGEAVGEGEDEPL